MWIFAPKAPADDGVVIDPQDSRALALKGTVNKIVGGAWLWWLKHVVALHAAGCQRGFTPGRNVVQNVVASDVDFRRLAMQRHASTSAALPALVTWDFAAAFPSVSHEVLWLAWQRWAFLKGYSWS